MGRLLDQDFTLEQSETSSSINLPRSTPLSVDSLPRSGLVVCWACSVAWRWKSSTQP